ncbi:MAG: substrate-binding domain-containing protein, partial [Candidatus Acidiferrum sp.]
MARLWKTVFVLVLTLTVIVPVATNGQDSTVLVVTGSSMPEPLYLAWNDEYHKQEPNVKVRYLPEGSGAGAIRVLTGTGDFAGGDAPIPEKELKTATSQVVELPTVLI